MPQVIPVVLGAVASNFVSGVVGGGIIGAIVGGVVGSAVVSFTAPIFAPKPKQAKFSAPSVTSISTGSRGRTEMVNQPITAHRIVYGRTRVSGPLVFTHSRPVSGSDNKLDMLHWVIVLAAHEVEEIEDILLNDETVPLDGNGAATSEPYKRDGTVYASIYKHLGESDQTADQVLVDNSGGQWTNAHRLRGLAYIHAEMRYDDKAYASGTPNISAIVKGRSKSDLFAMFIERTLELVKESGVIGMVTMQSWMFLSSYEKLRNHLLNKKTILSMAHLGSRGFDSIGGEVVSTTAFTIQNGHHENQKGQYLRLTDGKSEAEKANDFQSNKIANGELYFSSSSADFKKIPGLPIAYWISSAIRDSFINNKIEDDFLPKFGMSVGDGELFTKLWHEVAISDIGFKCSSEDDFNKKNYSWCPTDKGGTFRKWYGNKQHVTFWQNKGHDIRAHKSSAVRSPDLFFKEHCSWTLISSSNFACRYFGQGFLLDTASNCVYSKQNEININVLGFLNSTVSEKLLHILNQCIFRFIHANLILNVKIA